MGFTEALTLLFIALKLTHNIDWPWWQVLLPEIIAVGLYVVGLLTALIVWVVAALTIKRRYKRATRRYRGGTL